MTRTGTALLVEILRRDQHALLQEWVRLQLDRAATRRDLMSEAELREQSHQFLSAMLAARSSGEPFQPSSPTWTPIREFLTRTSENRARQGFTPSETASFVFSLKEPVFNRLRASMDGAALATELWSTTLLLDA